MTNRPLGFAAGKNELLPNVKLKYFEENKQIGRSKTSTEILSIQLKAPCILGPLQLSCSRNK